MTRWKHVTAAALMALAGCCATTAQRTNANWIDPGQAVLRAADAPQTGITGVFALTVRATGRADKVYLNSETDYRDPRNLTIALMPEAVAELAQALGGAPEELLRGKRILVSGTAMRTRIDFTVDGRQSGKYYYQTHVRVDQASQIKVL